MMEDVIILFETQKLLLKTSFFKESNNSKQTYTQSLVQKWIREEHNIDIEIIRSWSVSKGYHYILKPDDNYENQIIQYSEVGRSYETCLEQALVKSLEIIINRKYENI